MKRIYLDHAATTYLDPRVIWTMAPYWRKKFGNPSSLYFEGRQAKEAIEKSRKTVAKILNCRKEEVYFVGSGTESDNLAILGVARRSKNKGNHLITTQIEHHAVLYSFQQLEKEGFKVTYLPVDKYGLVSPLDLKKAITPQTTLVSIMYANNEIGTIEPIAEISQVIKSSQLPRPTSPATCPPVPLAASLCSASGLAGFGRRGELAGGRATTNYQLPYFHTDACQAAGYLDLDVQKLGVDLLTINGSKIYGPKGVGVLYIKKGVNIDPIIYGGGQENGLRPGTENVAGIVGLAKALEICHQESKFVSQRLINLRDYLIKGILNSIPKVLLNGHPKNRLPNNVNVSILDIEGEALILHLDKLGIAASTGSACTSGNLEPSHVLKALGLPYEACHGSLRLSLGRKTAKEDLDYLLKILPIVVKKLRNISPLDTKFK